MDKAPDFGSGDCRFESCHGRSLFVFILFQSLTFDIFVLPVLSLLNVSQCISHTHINVVRMYTSSFASSPSPMLSRPVSTIQNPQYKMYTVTPPARVPGPPERRALEYNAGSAPLTISHSSVREKQTNDFGRKIGFPKSTKTATTPFSFLPRWTTNKTQDLSTNILCHHS